jgi:hypothetical protein
MAYIFNPKTAGSGIITAIPQKGTCPNNCEDCFFQSGRSYLEPLGENLPNMPSYDQAAGRVVRMNDGNDSNVDRDLVIEASKSYPDVFFNTAIPRDIGKFPRPVVLTINPGKITDTCWNGIEGRGLEIEDSIDNLMFVRIRTNTWNLKRVVDPAVDFYTSIDVPVVLTFMAYYGENSIKPGQSDLTYFDRHREKNVPLMNSECYVQRKRTLNSYWAITTEAWRDIMSRYEDKNLVYSCGHIEGELGNTKCKHCGNCLREYYAAKERMG